MVGAARRFAQYAITGLTGTATTDETDSPRGRAQRWLADVHRWSSQGVSYIQLREKELGAGELFALAQAGIGLLREIASSHGERTLLLLNGRTDIAVAAKANGVHLTAHPGELTPHEARRIFRSAGVPRCFLSVSCHTLVQVRHARDAGADAILFGPVFEKRLGNRVVVAGAGVARLQEACCLAAPTPVFALGGVTALNAQECLLAGASGLAGIRLFAEPLPSSEPSPQPPGHASP